MISARGVRRAFSDGEGGRLNVLDGVDLEVKQGELVAVMGRSGSGKSTLLHILGGLDSAFEGEVTVAGAALKGLGDRALARFRNSSVGFVFQSFHLVGGLDALDNVALPAFFGEVEGDSRARAREALERVGLAARAHRQPAQLSGGERQRVAIARAIFARPKVLFCDEPTGNLDAATGAEIIELFRGLNRDGLTILAVTHEERVSNVAQRVLRLEGGKLGGVGAA
jgi:putative ABC transport system ATP-binding protein